MNKTLRSLVVAAAATSVLSLITLATASPSAAPAGAAGAASAASTTSWKNWGGYVAVAPNGKRILGVSTTFTIPKAAPKNSVGSPRPYEATMWAGMDGSPYGGYSGVEQAGVWAKASSKTAAPTYQLFWELYPAGPQYVANAHVKPGDQVFVQVIAPGTQYHDGKVHFLWRIGATIYERSGYPHKGMAVNGQHSAEVITEVPTVKSGLHVVEAAALDMGTVHYTDADYSLQGDAPVMGIHSVTQHKILARYLYAWSFAKIIPSNPSASSPSYGTAWKTDSFTTGYSHLGL